MSFRARSGFLALAILLFAAPALAQTVPSKPLELADVLAIRKHATLGTHEPKTVQITGVLRGLGLTGTYTQWQSGDKERFDERLGIRSERTYRVATGVYVQDANGLVRQLGGSELARERTNDFVSSEQFVIKTEFVQLLGRAALAEGRDVYRLLVSPPGGQPEEVDVDANSGMLDRISYDEQDGTTTIDSFDWHIVKGTLVPFRQVQSDGDHRFDIVQTATNVRVDGQLADDTFTVPISTQIETSAPVTVAMQKHRGNYYVPVVIGGHRYNFIIDSGAQQVVFDSRVAKELGLAVEGDVEVKGAGQTTGDGVAAIPGIEVGGATIPLHTADVIDLSNIGDSQVRVDGILGYPFFAAAEVRIDADRRELTIGRPGTLPSPGVRLTANADQELIEVNALINGVDGIFILDTGNSGNLFVFEPYLKLHPTVVDVSKQQTATFGVGGVSTSQIGTTPTFSIGSLSFRDETVRIATSDRGAFSDRIYAGNIGIGFLARFIVTFDVSNRNVYLQPRQQIYR